MAGLVPGTVRPSALEELEGLLVQYNNLVASKAESHMRPTLTQLFPRTVGFGL